MSRYFMDTEFHEYKKKPFLGKAIDTIELISIGIVTEDLEVTGTSIENPEPTSEIISGRTYYAICNEFDMDAAWKNEWLRENVLRSIYNDCIMSIAEKEYPFSKKVMKRVIRWEGKSKFQISKEILQFTGGNANVLQGEMKLTWETNTNPEFYAYFGQYDWVVFCWLYGRMDDLPKGYPMYCRDLKQMLDEKQHEMIISGEILECSDIDDLSTHPNYPKQKNEHNALDDAKFNYRLYEYLTAKT